MLTHHKGACVADQQLGWPLATAVCNKIPNHVINKLPLTTVAVTDGRWPPLSREISRTSIRDAGRENIVHSINKKRAGQAHLHVELPLHVLGLGVAALLWFG